MTTQWTNWPATERQSPPGGPASEMNETFFERWNARDSNHTSRICPGLGLGGTYAFPPIGAWTASGFGTQKLWVPPWASRLLVRVTMATNSGGGSEASAIAYARPKLGAVIGTVMYVRLECVVEYSGGPFHDLPVCVADVDGADGWPGNQSLFAKESVIEIPEAMRDTEQDFSYDVRRDDSSTLYVRVFNDANDATSGHRHRHWLFLEAA